ncbi:MAG TPA: hypothetical protein VJW20_01960 [Candidatus Angelobacter sp.]|nr:hypothetical protein [Candidatus Angelobacter sp.]
MAPRVIRLLFTWLLFGALAFAGDTGVLLDRSGSMKPHYQSGLMHTLASRLVQAASSPGRPDIDLFDEGITAHIKDLDSADFNYTNKNTYLNDSLTKELEGHARVWLLTDNVQDTGNSHDMADFYSTLHSEAVRRVYIFPLRQPQGEHQGLLIYAISTQENDTTLEQQVAAFRGLMKDKQISELIMKPLGENTIEIKLIEPAATKRFKEGEPLKFSSRVSIGPKYPHLYFESLPVTGMNLETPFRGTTCLTAERHVSSIDPERIQTREAANYVISVDFGRVRLKRSLSCIWEAAFERSHETEEIDTPLVVKVPREKFRLSQKFLQEYTANDEQEAQATGKIAGLQELPSYLAPPETIVPIRVPTKIIVDYPFWPTLLVFLLLAGVVFIGYLAIKFLGGISFTREEVHAETFEGKPLPAAVKSGEVSVAGKRVGTVQSGIFRPLLPAKLSPYRAEAPISAPITCIAGDGSQFRLIFGANSNKSQDRPKTQSASAGPRIELKKR